MANGLSRLADPLPRRAASLAEAARGADGKPLDGEEAEELGLVTFALDEIDWDDEVRIVLEERASFSPDALTGMEANLRFAGPETMETKIFAPADRLAELDLPAPERGRRGGRAEALRHRAQPAFDLERV